MSRRDAGRLIWSNSPALFLPLSFNFARSITNLAIETRRPLLQAQLPWSIVGDSDTPYGGILNSSWTALTCNWQDGQRFHWSSSESKYPRHREYVKSPQTVMINKIKKHFLATHLCLSGGRLPSIEDKWSPFLVTS